MREWNELEASNTSEHWVRHRMMGLTACFPIYVWSLLCWRFYSREASENRHDGTGGEMMCEAEERSAFYFRQPRRRTWPSRRIGKWSDHGTQYALLVACQDWRQVVHSESSITTSIDMKRNPGTGPGTSDEGAALKAAEVIASLSDHELSWLS
ncbi:hypothetical protein BDN72DRAFT_843222 [Pluteus cervinus]|uniref:Uncharacterized protein n=1 Tax=Pluteus cervinus TaxID=181527 RepID=A0ACD3AN57_9AGAR|nr:hypothetical protein BDN72DRAFT_843222 [Pluteus cervinus]